MAEEAAHPTESGTQKERRHGAETPTFPLGHTLDGPIPPLGPPRERVMVSIKLLVHDT